jgi:hypothetical protein
MGKFAGLEIRLVKAAGQPPEHIVYTLIEIPGVTFKEQKTKSHETREEER